jgi:hypothetical protein
MKWLWSRGSSSDDERPHARRGATHRSEHCQAARAAGTGAQMIKNPGASFEIAVDGRTRSTATPRSEGGAGFLKFKTK